MSTWKNEKEAREQIKAMVAEYYHDFKEMFNISAATVEVVSGMNLKPMDMPNFLLNS